MSKTHTALTRIPTAEGAPYVAVFNIGNIIELSPNFKGDGTTCWMKYWDGSTVRSSMLQGTVEENMDIIND